MQTTGLMDLFAQANSQGIQTEFLDGQGHRRVTDAAALKIILDALPPPVEPRDDVEQFPIHVVPLGFLKRNFPCLECFVGRSSSW